MAGGEHKVIELLEDESKQVKKPLLEGEENPELKRKTIRDFIFRPSVLGKDLLTIEKFGLVQYVSQKEKIVSTFDLVIIYLIFLHSFQMILKTVCAFLALILELFGVYGDGEFKWNYGYVSFSGDNFHLVCILFYIRGSVNLCF